VRIRSAVILGKTRRAYLDITYASHLTGQAWPSCGSPCVPGLPQPVDMHGSIGDRSSPGRGLVEPQARVSGAPLRAPT